MTTICEQLICRLIPKTRQEYYLHDQTKQSYTGSFSYISGCRLTQTHPEAALHRLFLIHFQTTINSILPSKLLWSLEFNQKIVKFSRDNSSVDPWITEVPRLYSPTESSSSRRKTKIKLPQWTPPQIAGTGIPRKGTSYEVSTYDGWHL